MLLPQICVIAPGGRATITNSDERDVLKSSFLQPAPERLERANAWFLEQRLALMFLSTVLQSLLKEVKAHPPGWGLLERSTYY